MKLEILADPGAVAREAAAIIAAEARAAVAARGDRALMLADRAAAGWPDAGGD
jgi:hypothetical protein